MMPENRPAESPHQVFHSVICSPLRVRIVEAVVAGLQTRLACLATTVVLSLPFQTLRSAMLSQHTEISNKKKRAGREVEGRVASPRYGTTGV
jgi:hypothetical protein